MSAVAATGRLPGGSSLYQHISSPRFGSGLVRVEVQAPKQDASLIRALADRLRSKPEKAKALRSTLATALMPELATAFDVFGSDRSDEVFAGVFEQRRERDWRKVSL